MTATRESTSDEFFEALYAANRDPWRFTRSPYERRKYRATLAALAASTPCAATTTRFRAALEVGCSIGVMTRLLARRCRRLLALDVSDNALREARRRRLGLAGVALRRARVPGEFPPGTFDLIVLSEVLYFLSEADIAALARLAMARLQPGGIVVIVNWTGRTGTAVDGARARALFLRLVAGRLRPIRRVRHPHYRLDVARRPR